MTTIAFDGKVLAADTQYMEGEHTFGYTRKLLLLPNGYVLAYAGVVGLAWKIADAIAKTKKIEEALTKKQLKEIDVLLIDSNGQPFYLDASYGSFLAIEETHSAIGSGKDIALAAMRDGRTAPEAVRLVSLVHKTTNNLIDTYNIETKAFSLADFPK